MSEPPTSVHVAFSIVRDPRIERSKHYPLLDLLTIALCAVVCGADSFVEMERFGHAKQDWFETFLDLPFGIPSHDTFGRVFALLDPAELQAGLLAWTQAVLPETDRPVVALDGKTLRRSHDRTNGHDALQLVSAWVSANHLFLGHQAVPEGGSEITTLPQLIDLLDLKRAIVTIDAAGTQPEVTQRLVDQEADYVLALKANQPTLHQDVAQVFQEARDTTFAGIAYDTYETLEKGHGRLEQRRTWIIHDPDYLAWLDEDDRWSGLKSVALVERECRIGDEVTLEPRYFLSSLTDARELAEAVRLHWGIENSFHWILDVVFREDDSRVRVGYAIENLALVRRLALQLLKQETTAKVGIKVKRNMAGWDNAYLLKVLQP